MKSLNEYIIEGGFFKNVKAEIVTPKNKKELIDIIKDTIAKAGPNCDLNFIDTSKIDDMSALFYSSEFNGDISNWDVSNVTTMAAMFANSKFNGDISKWDVSNVTSMAAMFAYSEFTGDISKWDVSKVTIMREMFNSSKLKKLDKLPDWYK